MSYQGSSKCLSNDPWVLLVKQSYRWKPDSGFQQKLKNVTWQSCNLLGHLVRELISLKWLWFLWNCCQIPLGCEPRSEDETASSRWLRSALCRFKYPMMSPCFSTSSSRLERGQWSVSSVEVFSDVLLTGRSCYSLGFLLCNGDTGCIVQEGNTESTK